MGEIYTPSFPVGSRIRVISKAALEKFAQSWKYHHKLLPEQMEFAGASSTVKEVSFYHGGDQLYVLENLPGIWNEPCIEPADQETSREYDSR
jgi:hypothetical protein